MYVCYLCIYSSICNSPAINAANFNKLLIIIIIVILSTLRTIEYKFTMEVIVEKVKIDLSTNKAVIVRSAARPSLMLQSKIINSMKQIK